MPETTSIFSEKTNIFTFRFAFWEEDCDAKLVI